MNYCVLSRGLGLLSSKNKLQTLLFKPNFLVPVRTVWGNEHEPTPRGKNRPNKHRDPKYRKFRGAKMMKIELPDYDFQRAMENDEISPSEIKAYMKEKGILPISSYQEKASYISCTGGVLEEFVPPEGDGKASIVSKEGAKQSVTGVGKKGKSFMAVRKIRQYDEAYDPSVFVEEAQEIYIQAHNAIARKDEEALHKYATEKAIPEMLMNVSRKSMSWQFIKSLEPPRVVQARTQDVMTKANLFAQVTVRFNTQQTLAIYDRFGRLIYGNPDVAKDVLEYVVFEKHLANMYGNWRVHAKIIPDWLEDKEGARITHVLKEVQPQEQEEEEEDTAVVKDDSNKSQKTEEDSDDGKELVYDRYGRVMSSNKD